MAVTSYRNFINGEWISSKQKATGSKLMFVVTCLYDDAWVYLPCRQHSLIPRWLLSFIVVPWLQIYDAKSLPYKYS